MFDIERKRVLKEEADRREEEAKFNWIMRRLPRSWRIHISYTWATWGGQATLDLFDSIIDCLINYDVIHLLKARPEDTRPKLVLHPTVRIERWRSIRVRGPWCWDYSQMKHDYDY